MQCFADWGLHGQRMRSVENSDEVRDTLSTQNAEPGLIYSNNPYKDTMPRQNTDPAIKKNIADTGTSGLRDSFISCSDTLKNNIKNSGGTVYNASIIDYYGREPDSVIPVASIKKFRGTVVPGGDTVHFKIPVYGNISLENIEFSGLVYKESEIAIEETEYENPHSFSSGFWIVFSSLGGLITSAALTKPAFAAGDDDRADMITWCILGYMASGAGQYFGVSKLVKHFRWNNQFGNR
jgi:hypothetical protein